MEVRLWHEPGRYVKKQNPPMVRIGGSSIIATSGCLRMPAIAVAVARRGLVPLLDLLVLFRRPIVVAALLSSRANRHCRSEHQRYYDCTYFFHLPLPPPRVHYIRLRERRRAYAP